MKTTWESEKTVRVEWEPSDFDALDYKTSPQLLYKAAEKCASYFAGIAEGFASDDDTDYINFHAEAILAINQLWYDGQTEPIAEYMNWSANTLYGNEISAIEAFEQKNTDGMIEFILTALHS